MNILFYIPTLTQNLGGVRQYAKGILEIIAQDVTNQCFVYHNNDDSEILKVLSCNPHLKLVKDADIIVPPLPSRNRKRLIKCWNLLSRKLHIGKPMVIEVPNFIDVLCEQFAIDIIHCPYQFIPKTEKVKLITTLHDVQEIHFPEYFTAEERAHRANGYLDYLRRADRVIVSYQHVKDDLIKYFAVPAGKIDILLLKMDNLWFSKFSDTDIIDLQRLELPEKFFLYPANTWKHKNHLRLVEAVAIAREKYHTNINVVCTGHQNEHFAEIEKRIKELNIQDLISFKGIVSEIELFSLYKKCSGVVIPTTYEAGSFPLYESILLNVPVVCSNVTSLPETIGSEEFTFNPFDVEAMVNKMLELWDDNDFRSKNIEQLKLAINKIKENNPLPILQKIYK